MCFSSDEALASIPTNGHLGCSFFRTILVETRIPCRPHCAGFDISTPGLRSRPIHARRSPSTACVKRPTDVIPSPLDEPRTRATRVRARFVGSLRERSHPLPRQAAPPASDPVPLPPPTPWTRQLLRSSLKMSHTRSWWSRAQLSGLQLPACSPAWSPV